MFYCWHWYQSSTVSSVVGAPWRFFLFVLLFCFLCFFLLFSSCFFSFSFSFLGSSKSDFFCPQLLRDFLTILKKTFFEPSWEVPPFEAAPLFSFFLLFFVFVFFLCLFSFSFSDIHRRLSSSLWWLPVGYQWWSGWESSVDEKKSFKKSTANKSKVISKKKLEVNSSARMCAILLDLFGRWCGITHQNVITKKNMFLHVFLFFVFYICFFSKCFSWCVDGFTNTAMSNTAIVHRKQRLGKIITCGSLQHAQQQFNARRSHHHATPRYKPRLFCTNVPLVSDRGAHRNVCTLHRLNCQRRWDWVSAQLLFMMFLTIFSSLRWSWARWICGWSGRLRLSREACFDQERWHWSWRWLFPFFLGYGGMLRARGSPADLSSASRTWSSWLSWLTFPSFTLHLDLLSKKKTQTTQSNDLKKQQYMAHCCKKDLWMGKKRKRIHEAHFRRLRNPTLHNTTTTHHPRDLQQQQHHQHAHDNDPVTSQVHWQGRRCACCAATTSSQDSEGAEDGGNPASPVHWQSRGRSSYGKTAESGNKVVERHQLEPIFVKTHGVGDDKNVASTCTPPPLQNAHDNIKLTVSWFLFRNRTLHWQCILVVKWKKAETRGSEWTPQLYVWLKNMWGPQLVEFGYLYHKKVPT